MRIRITETNAAHAADIAQRIRAVYPEAVIEWTDTANYEAKSVPDSCGSMDLCVDLSIVVRSDMPIGQVVNTSTIYERITDGLEYALDHVKERAAGLTSTEGGR